MASSQAVYSLNDVVRMVTDASDVSDFSNEESDDDRPPDSDSSSEEDHVSMHESEASDSDSEPTQVGCPGVAARTRGHQRGRGRGRARVVPQPRGNPEEPNDGFRSKSGLTWSAEPPQQYRRRMQDIIRQQPGVTAAGRKDTIAETFGLYLTDDIVSVIIRETNREADRVFAKWNADNPNKQRVWQNISRKEMMAFLGLLVLAGIYHGSHEPLEELWSSCAGRPVFVATMSLKRFKAILRYIRFDNKNTRTERRAIDKLAPMRDIWEMFVSQLRKFYIPGSDITVDEQLMPFRGRCPFRQYIPNKPAKYGIKIWWACDAFSSYPLNGAVYLGRQPGANRAVNQGSNVVHSLISPWYGSGRNVVADNFFTSVPLAKDLLLQQMTYVGTIRRNKPDIPPALTSMNREPLSSLFAFSDELTLASYMPKRGKLVLVLSSMHHDKTTEGENQKPEIILHYNDTKSGVDNMDKMASGYTCKRKTNRWPLALFFNMIDVAGIAALVVWLASNPKWEESSKRRRRRKFLCELGHALVKDQITERLEHPECLRKPIKEAMKHLSYLPRPSLCTVNETKLKGRCRLCDRDRDRKTRQKCTSCGKFVCQEHAMTSVTCYDCL